MGVLTGLAIAGIGSSIIGGMMSRRAQGEASREQAKSDKEALEYMKDKDALEQVSWADRERRMAPRRGMAAAAEGFLAHNFFPGGWENPISQMAESPSEAYARRTGQERLGMPASRPAIGPSGMPMGKSLYEPDPQATFTGGYESLGMPQGPADQNAVNFRSPGQFAQQAIPASNMLEIPGDEYQQPLNLREGTGGE